MNIKDFKIKNLKCVRFGNELIQCETKGYSIYHPEMGFMQLAENYDPYGVQLPYNPLGGRKVLKSFLETWDINKFKEAQWIKQYNN